MERGHPKHRAGNQSAVPDSTKLLCGIKKGSRILILPVGILFGVFVFSSFVGIVLSQSPQPDSMLL